MSRRSEGVGSGIRVIVLALVLVGVSASAAFSTEVTVQNDSFVSGGSAVIVGGFHPGEQAAVWLTSPCDGTIVALQVAWLASDPGATFSLERNIWVYDGGTFPNPGAVLEQLEGPVLWPGVINEYRYLDDNNSFPINIPVTAGQTFVVSLEFDNYTYPLSGSVVRDVDGCQNGRNALYDTGGSWSNFCALLAGDLVIRAVIDCEDPIGACCLPSGDCSDGLTEAACAAMDGTYQGDDVLCSEVECPQPTEACCFLPEGCLDLSVDDCYIAAGYPQGPGTDCNSTVCFPTGACCMPDGSCVDEMPEEDYLAADGTFQGDDVLCSEVECPQPAGACCLSNGNCLELDEADCGVIPNSSWAGIGTDCDDADENGTADDCEAVPGDCDGDGDIDLSDFFTFQTCFTGPDGGPVGQECECVDFDDDDDVDLQDFLAFQTSFTGPG